MDVSESILSMMTNLNGFDNPLVLWIKKLLEGASQGMRWMEDVAWVSSPSRLSLRRKVFLADLKHLLKTKGALPKGSIISSKTHLQFIFSPLEFILSLFKHFEHHHHPCLYFHMLMASSTAWLDSDSDRS